MARVLSCLALLLLPAAPLAARASRPNILLLFPDQWRHDFLPAPLSERAPALRMPTLLSLAARGTRFTHATVPSPLCAPSRACLASGREYDEAGVPDNFSRDYPVNETTFYTLLRGAGYTVMTSGKDDLTKSSGPGRAGDRNAAALGFSAWARAAGKQDVVNRGAPFEPYGLWAANQSLLVRGENTSFFSLLKSAVADACEAAAGAPAGYACAGATPLPQAGYEDDWVTANALALLAAAPAAAPWFLHVSFPGPHPPFVCTAAMLNSTARDDYPPAVNNSGTAPTAQAAARRAYAAELEHLDALFAQLLAAVDARGERGETLVIVASDHGEMLGDLDDWGKTMPWQGSASVPLLFAGLGVPAGAALAAPVATLDIAGTVLDYAGVAPAAGMTTRSLRGALAGGAPPRSHVSSGLAAWRSVLQTPPANSSAIFKLVCCRGACPGGDGGAPYVGGDARDYAGLLPAGARGYAPGGGGGGGGSPRGGAAADTVKLFEVVSDPFDLFDVAAAHPDAVARMRALLPAGWCAAAAAGAEPPPSLKR